MRTEPTEVHLQTDRIDASDQDKTYIAAKLRGAAVMYGPAVVLDLFEGISVLVTVSGRLPDPQGSRTARILRLLAAVGALAPWAYLLIVRPWHINWGATDEEVHKSLPGDDVVPHPMLETTHAVTIDASAEEIWPWLVQMGHYRAGFYADPTWWDKYSDKYLRSLTRKEAEGSGYGFRDKSSAERIVPEFQDLKIGDTILDGPPG